MRCFGHVEYKAMSNSNNATGWCHLLNYGTSHSTQNRSFWRRSKSQSLGLVCKKTKPNTTKAHIYQSKCTTTQNYHKKLTRGLVASYDIRPGNVDGLFCYWHFINLSFAYLLRHLSTYLQPQTHRRRMMVSCLNNKTVRMHWNGLCNFHLLAPIIWKHDVIHKTGST